MNIAITAINIAITAIMVLVSWLVVRWILKRYLQFRRKTQSGQEWQNYKAKLPGWVKATERVLWIILWLPLAYASMTLLNMLYFIVHSTQMRPDGAASGLMIMSSLFVTLVPALLLVNVASWLVSPIRKANLAAMEGLATASFRTANMGLLKFGAVVVPVSLAVAFFAAIAPWAK